MSNQNGTNYGNEFIDEKNKALGNKKLSLRELLMQYRNNRKTKTATSNAINTTQNYLIQNNSTQEQETADSLVNEKEDQKQTEQNNKKKKRNSSKKTSVHENTNDSKQNNEYKNVDITYDQTHIPNEDDNNNKYEDENEFHNEEPSYDQETTNINKKNLQNTNKNKKNEDLEDDSEDISNTTKSKNKNKEDSKNKNINNINNKNSQKTRIKTNKNKKIKNKSLDLINKYKYDYQPEMRLVYKFKDGSTLCAIDTKNRTFYKVLTAPCMDCGYHKKGTPNIYSIMNKVEFEVKHNSNLNNGAIYKAIQELTLYLQNILPQREIDNWVNCLLSHLHSTNED